MAKEVVLTQLKKGTASFNLVGKAKVSDFTFKIDMESKKEDSDWVYNHMNLAVDCGDNGMIYADVMSGYGTERQNKIMVHGKKKNEAGFDVDDFKNFFTIDWEDRFDEEIVASCGDRNFFTVGLTKENDKVEYKKFLSAYDGIKYAEENLQDGTVVNVKGDLKYSRYNDAIQVKKEITSLVLSKAEYKDFRASFTQSIILDSDSIGKPDKETMTVPITGLVVDYMKEFDGKVIRHLVKGKTKQGTNLPIVKTLDFKMGEDMEQVKKMLRVFKVKGKKLTQLTVDGYFTKGDLNTVSVTEDDIPDDIKELIDLGYIDKDEILGQIALKNGGKKPETMVISKPHIKYIGEDVKMPSIDKVIDAYEEDDVNPLMIIGALVPVKQDNKEEVIVEDKEEKKDEQTSDKEDKDLDEALKDDSKDDDEDEDWLSDL